MRTDLVSSQGHYQSWKKLPLRTLSLLDFTFSFFPFTLRYLVVWSRPSCLSTTEDLPDLGPGSLSPVTDWETEEASKNEEGYLTGVGEADPGVYVVRSFVPSSGKSNYKLVGMLLPFSSERG